MAAKKSPGDLAVSATRYCFFALIALILVYLVGGIIVPGIENKGIVGGISTRFLPVWIALAVSFALSITFKRSLGLYGKLFDSLIGMIGFAIVMFWVFTGVFSTMDLIVTHDPLGQVSGMKNKSPGEPARWGGSWRLCLLSARRRQPGPRRLQPYGVRLVGV